LIQINTTGRSAPATGAMSEIDAERFRLLAEGYHDEAAVCRQMAERTGAALQECWLRLAAVWTRLAQEAEAMRWRN
jgi:hypothetical protein